jgi:four helix bundle protein
MGEQAMKHHGTHRGDELAERLAKYAGEVLRVTAELPGTKEGRHVRDQLLRSGTAPGAHYAEARSGQSAKDFIHKVGLAAKEARESVHWLRTSVYARFVKRDIEWLINEGQEITAILTASLQTARNNHRTSSH